MSYNRAWIDIDECIGYITNQVVEFENSISLFKEADERRQQNIRNVSKQIREIEDAKSVRNNGNNNSIEELEERVRNCNNDFSVGTYSLICSYIDLLKSAIQELEDTDHWDRIIHCIEENENFSSFKRKYSNSTDLLNSFHYSEFFRYTEEDIKEILSSSLFISAQKRNAQMKLYSLYADFKNFYEKNYYYRTINIEKRKYADAIKKLDAWIMWSRNKQVQLKQILENLYAEQSYHDKVASAEKICLNNIYQKYSPKTISELCRKCGISFTKDISDSNDVSDDVLENPLPPFVELYKGHRTVFTNRQGDIDTKDLLREIVSTYNELFISNKNYEYLGVQTPVKAYLDKKANNFLFMPINSDSAIRLTYSISNHIKKYCFYPTQYYCCGKIAEKLIFLETKGAKCFVRPLQVLQDVFDIMIKREEKLQGLSYYDENNRLLFEGENLQLLLVLFVFDYEYDEINKGTSQDVLNELLRRGQRMGILVIRITEKNLLADEESVNNFIGNIWKEENKGIFKNNNISIVPTELYDSKLDLLFKKEKKDAIDKKIFSKLIMPDSSSKLITYQKQLRCPIGVTYDLREKELDISMYHNFIYIMGDAYSGRTSAARVILKSILNNYEDFVHMYIVDLSIGGIEYSRYKDVKSSAIKMLAFDCGYEVVQATLMVVIKEIRRLADIFRRYQVFDYIEYAKKTNESVKHNIVLIDGAEYLDMQSIQMLKEIIVEGVRYNIQVVLVGNEIQELKAISSSQVIMGLNKDNKKYVSERKGMSKLDIDDTVCTIRWYYDEYPYSLRSVKGNNDTYVICREAIDRPKSVISLFLNDEMNILDEDSIRIDFGSDLTVFDEATPVSNILINRTKERENVLIVGGTENHIDAIFSNIIASLLIYKKRNKKRTAIILLSPMSEILKHVASVFCNDVIVANIEEYVEIGITSEEREVFILIDNFNANESFVFDPSNSGFQVKAAGRFIQQCLSNKQTHIIAWCDDPKNVHPILSQGNSFFAFLRLFSHRIHLRINREGFESRDLDIFQDCVNMNDNEAWVYTEKNRKLVYPYRRITNSVWDLIAEKIGVKEQ